MDDILKGKPMSLEEIFDREIKPVVEPQCKCLDCNWTGNACQAIVHEAINLHHIQGWTQNLEEKYQIGK